MDFLDKKLAEIKARLDELQPAVDEYQQLAHAYNVLAGTTNSKTPRKQGSKPRKRTNKGTGKPGAKPTRAPQAEKLIAKNPGISIKDLAEKMDIHVQALYRILPKLQDEGKIVKTGDGWKTR